MIAAGGVRRLNLAALKPQRAAVLAGGLAIMNAALAELDVDVIEPVGGALRLGVLYDLLGRTEEHDARVETVEQFMQRYAVDREHAQRIASLASDLLRGTQRNSDAVAMQRLTWAALLHEVGLSVSHTGFHKHGAYILRHADMPGFSDAEQEWLSQLVLGCRGGLAKMGTWLHQEGFRAKLFCLRLAVILHHARRPIELPKIKLESGAAVGVRIPKRWLAHHPLTEHLLEIEAQEWAAAGYVWKTR
jgi:exopolyphosphatase/guanosine-5'-triphosphate,3'-diphosphate pyrophosphatase